MTRSAAIVLEDEQLNLLWKGIDIVGDIAIIKIQHDLDTEKSQIARELLNAAPRLKVVLNQVSPVESPLRIRRLEWLAGEKRTVTVHKEFGCRYMVDVGQAYFSPRLSSERKRISDLVSPGECVVNFFAGVGCFSIMIAKHGRPRRIYSIDLNPVALRYHAANVSLNRVSGEIDMICGDARTIVASSLHGQADRVLLPLPELAINSLEAARQALRNGVGTVHCYLFVEARRKLEATQATFSKLKPVLGDLVTPRNRARVHVIRSVGPCRYQVCADIMYG